MGKRVGKDALIIEVIGAIDELSSGLSFVAREKHIGPIVHSVQEHLFYLAADIAGLAQKKAPSYNDCVAQYESTIDILTKKLPPLTNFIFPGGHESACHLFQARAICRRLERVLVALSKKIKVKKDLLIYVNRLSDLLFTLARYANKLHATQEILWKPAK